MRIALPIMFLATAAAVPVPFNKFRMHGPSLPFSSLDDVSNELATMERSGDGEEEEIGVVVSGLSGTSRDGTDMARFNGAYWPDPGAKERRGYAQEHGKGTIEKVSWGWVLDEDYRGNLYYFCKSDSPTPPLTGWENTGWGTEPPPSLSSTTRPAQAHPLR